MNKLTLLTTAFIAALMIGCGRTSRAPEPNPLAAPPIDSTKVSSADEATSWNYRKELLTDLDGDRQEDQLILAADVELRPDGAPLWEDAHRWAVYVESAGRRTLLYAGLVPNGFVEAAALARSDAGHRLVLIQERTPSQLRSLEVDYVRPGEAHLSSAAYYQIDTWLPGSARLSRD